MADVFRPTELPEALQLISDRKLTLLAGGTDFYPLMGERQASDAICDIGLLRDLSEIAAAPAEMRIGAGVTWSAIRRAALPAAFDGLRAAAREVGSVQIQNAGTIGGNLCNASPAADGVPPLLALGAAVELASLRGVRRLPLDAFLIGPRRTALAADEMMTAVIVPAPAQEARSAFLKLGARTHLVISIAMVAATLTPDPRGRVAAARVAVGSCSPVARRLPALEAALVGRPMRADALAGAVTEAALAPLAPIDDVRATAAYRLKAAAELSRRALAQAAAEPAAEAAA